ncbi:MFS transporter [soil metagenome]
MKMCSPHINLFAWFICSLGALFYSYEYLLRIMPSVMTVELAQTYQIQAAALGNLAAIYYYVYTPMQLPAGILMDRYGPRFLLTIAALCCAIGTYFFVLTSSLLVAGTGRFLVGLGSAFAFVGVLKLATIWLPLRYFALFAGLTTTLGVIGAMTGNIGLTIIQEHLGWRTTVEGAALIGIVLAMAIGFFVRDQNPAKKAGEHPRATSLKEAGLGFINIIKNPRMWMVGLIGTLLYIPTSAFAELWGTPYLKSVLHFSPREAAIAVSMIFLGWAIGSPLAGWISDYLQRRRYPLICGALAAAFLISIVLYCPGLPKFAVNAIFLLFGIVSSVEVLVFAVGREISSSHASGSAIAFTNMMVMMGGVIFQPLIGVILDWHWNGVTDVNGLQVFRPIDYQIALTALPLGLLLAATLAFFFKEKPLSQSHCH